MNTLLLETLDEMLGEQYQEQERREDEGFFMIPPLQNITASLRDYLSFIDEFTATQVCHWIAECWEKEGGEKSRNASEIRHRKNGLGTFTTPKGEKTGIYLLYDHRCWQNRNYYLYNNESTGIMTLNLKGSTREQDLVNLLSESINSGHGCVNPYRNEFTGYQLPFVYFSLYAEKVQHRESYLICGESRSEQAGNYDRSTGERAEKILKRFIEMGGKGNDQ